MNSLTGVGGGDPHAAEANRCRDNKVDQRVDEDPELAGTRGPLAREKPIHARELVEEARARRVVNARGEPADWFTHSN